MFQSIDFGLLALNSPGWGGALLAGFWRSIQLAAGGYALGIVIGILGAVAKLYGGRVSRDLAEIYTMTIRAVPELVLMLIFYYAGTDLLNRLMGLFGAGGVDVNGLAAGILVIGLVQGGYTTEVIRAAILAVPRGQIEAAHSFGMSPMRVMRRITLPAMLPHAIPGMANLWMIATKDTGASGGDRLQRTDAGDQAGGGRDAGIFPVLHRGGASVPDPDAWIECRPAPVRAPCPPRHGRPALRKGETRCPTWTGSPPFAPRPAPSFWRACADC